MYLSKIVRASDHPYLYGKGGRFVSLKYFFLVKYFFFLLKANNEMTHLRLAFLGHQKGLWPLFVLGCVGASFTLWYMKR